MGILSNAKNRIGEFNRARIKKRIADLLRETSETEARFREEAKRFGIDLRAVTSKNYYEVLGVRFTNDEKEIRRAYLDMIKRYHPDVSKDKFAKERSEEINGAYAVLKDRGLKEEYDSNLSKGMNKMGEEVTRSMSNALLKAYSEERSRDFDEFRKRVATPQTRDAMRAAIAEVSEWERRFNRVSEATFSKLKDSGKSIRRLSGMNKAMVGSSGADEYRDRLIQNSRELGSMLQSYAEIERSISAIVENVRRGLREEEEKVASKMRNLV